LRVAAQVAAQVAVAKAAVVAKAGAVANRKGDWALADSTPLPSLPTVRGGVCRCFGETAAAASTLSAAD